MTRRQFFFLFIVILLGMFMPNKYKVYLPIVQQPVTHNVTKSGLSFPMTFPFSL